MSHEARAIAFGTVVLALSIAVAGCGGPTVDNASLATLERRCLAEERPSVSPESVALDPIDGGRLAVVLHGANARPPLGPVFVIDAAGQRRADVPGAAFVRFVDPGHLLVSGARIDETNPHAAFVVDATGLRIEPLALDRVGRIETAGDGRRFVAVVWPPVDSTGVARLVIRDLSDPTRDVAARPVEGRGESAFWSPDGDALAIDRVVESVVPLRFRDRLVTSQLLVSSPSLGTPRDLHTGNPGAPAPPNGIRVLGWTREGILGEDDRALVRCDPGGSGCVRVARFGALDRPLMLAAGPPGVVYVATTANTPCSALLFEVHRELAQRIERVELATGRVDTLLTLPAGIAVGDFDWTPVPEGEDATR